MLKNKVYSAVIILVIIFNLSLVTIAQDSLIVNEDYNSLQNGLNTVTGWDKQINIEDGSVFYTTQTITRTIPGQIENTYFSFDFRWLAKGTGKGWSIVFMDGGREIANVYLMDSGNGLIYLKDGDNNKNITAYTFSPGEASDWFKLNVIFDVPNSRYTAWVGENPPSNTIWAKAYLTPAYPNVTKISGIRFYARTDVNGQGNKVDNFKVCSYIADSNSMLSGINIGGYDFTGFDPNLNSFDYHIRLDDAYETYDKTMVEAVYDGLKFIKKTDVIRDGYKAVDLQVRSSNLSSSNTYNLRFLPFDANVSLVQGGQQVNRPNQGEAQINLSFTNGNQNASPILLTALYDNEEQIKSLVATKINTLANEQKIVEQSINIDNLINPKLDVLMLRDTNNLEPLIPVHSFPANTTMSRIYNSGKIIECNLLPQGETVTISGAVDNGEGRRVSIIVLKPGGNIESLDDENVDYIYMAKQLISNQNGRFNFVFNMESSADTGSYKVLIGNEGNKDSALEKSFLYFSPEKRAQILEEINNEPNTLFDMLNAENTERYPLYRETLNAMGFNIEGYDDSSGEYGKTWICEKIASKVFTDGVFGSEATLVDYFNGIVAVAAINSASVSTLDTVLLDSTKYIQLRIYNEVNYRDIDADIKPELLRLINLQVFENREDLLNGLKKLSAIARVNVSDYLKLTDLLSSNEKIKNTLEINSSSYNQFLNFNEYYKNFVSMEVKKQKYNNAQEFIEALKAGIDKALKAISNSSDSAKTEKKSSGGSSSFTLPNYPLNQTPTPSPIMEPNSDSTRNQSMYNDLENHKWAIEAVNSLTKEGVLKGTGEGKFEPSKGVTREQFVTMIVKALKLPNSKGNTTYTDTEKEAWYVEFISAASEAGIVKGNTDGSFGVGRIITRQEMAMMIYNALMYTKINVTTDTLVNYIDMDEVSDYALKAVAAITDKGIMRGVGDNEFRPIDICTRAQAAQATYMLHKVIFNDFLK